MKLAIKALLIDHADEVLDIAAEHTLAASLWPTPLGTDSAADCDRRAELQRAATREAEKVIARERSGEAIRPPFRGVLDAMRQLDAHRIDGASTGDSPFAAYDPDHAGRTERPASVVERVVLVGREWVLVFATGYDEAIETDVLRLSGRDARLVCEWSVLGIAALDVPRALFDARSGNAARQGRSKELMAFRGRFDEQWSGGFDRDHLPDFLEVARHATARFGVEVSAAHVGLIRRRGVAEMAARLSRCGLVPRQGVAEMATQHDEPAFDLHGWKAISEFLGVSVRAAQRWIAEGLRVYGYGPNVVARKTECREFQRARMQPKIGEGAKR